MLVPSGIHAKYPIPRNAEFLRNPRFSRTFTSKITHSIPRSLFSIAYLTALIFVVLLSHELICSPVARLLPPLVFTLGVSANQFFMLAQHGPALAPTLAYLFGLVYFWRRRTPSSFFVFLLFLSCFVASINYITFSSHLFPLVLFTIFLAALSSDFLGSAWAALRAAMATVRGRAMIALGTLSCILAFVNIELIPLP